MTDVLPTPLENQPVAIVTASSGGIGAAVAETLRARGWRLSLFASSDRIWETAERLSAFGIRGSLAEATDLDRLVRETAGHYGRIDALVNNSVRPRGGDVLTISDEDWGHGFEMQFLSAVRMTRLVVPHMRERGGAIVNISAYTAREPDQRYVIGGVMRAALNNFTRLAAEREASKGIRINGLLVGFVDNYPEDAGIVGAIPMGRYARISEIAETAAFLLSKEAGSITGTSLLIDGGLSRSV